VGAFVVRNQFVGGVEWLVEGVGRKESRFVGGIVVVGRWVGSLWVEVVERKVVVGVGRRVVVAVVAVGVGRVVVGWRGNLPDLYDK
jgi:hypothetical protein